jgi:group II intron reverse transcriptase/maturase
VKPLFDAMERIAYLSNVAKERKQLRFSKLYKVVQRKEFLEFAYEQIRGNKGSKTGGVDEITSETFADSKIKEDHLNQLSKDLSDESYKPLPVRRVMIEKDKGGYRPLGIPALKDRIVQSAVKIILEALYEPIFSQNSHGFRPKRSCQTAIEQIIVWKTDWVIEGDIKGCFDNVKHGKLLDLLRKRITDERFINLINKFLKSGYQMGYGIDGKLPIYITKNGTPQGSIVSPILANIYLQEFDSFMEKKIKSMNHKQNKLSHEYINITNRIGRISKALIEGKTEYKMRIYTSKNEAKQETFNTKEELQQHIEKLIEERSKYKGKEKEYKYLSRRIEESRKAIEKDKFPYISNVRGMSTSYTQMLNSKEEMVQKIKELKKQRRHVPKYDSDKYYSDTSLGYTRYADDCVPRKQPNCA